MEVTLSDAEKVFIMHGTQEGFRNDGRACSDYRPLFVERGVLSTTNGSARIRLGGSDVLVGIKCELIECVDSSKESERIEFGVDFSASATPQFQGKGGDEFALDIADALRVAYQNPLFIPDLEQLAVSSNHYWKLFVDVVILQYSGNILDAASIGVKAALFDCEIVVLRKRKGDGQKTTVELPEGECQTFSFDVSRAPLLCCISKVGTANVVDATIEEECCCFASLWVGVVPVREVNEEGPPLICLYRVASGGSLDFSSEDDMLQLGVHALSHLDSSLMKFLSHSERGIPGETFRN